MQEIRLGLSVYGLSQRNLPRLHFVSTGEEISIQVDESNKPVGISIPMTVIRKIKESSKGDSKEGMRLLQQALRKLRKKEAPVMMETHPQLQFTKRNFRRP